jgi:Ca2+-binding RTX toxin-like protein
VPAQAATVTEVNRSQDVAFTAARGEANNVTVTRDGGTYVVRDSGAPIFGSDGCVNRSAHVAVCTKVSQRYAFVTLGDGDDRVRFRKTSGRVWAGDGADVVRGANGFDALAGGKGSDELYGKGSNDILEDGRGPTTARGKDKLDGGGGLDSVTYSGHGTQPLEIDLAAGRGLGRDELTRIEEVTTAGGDDSLTGDAADNSFYARGGINILRGLGGDDVLSGGGGSTLDGGEGDDELRVASDVARASTIECGAGTDTVAAFAGDELSADCEFAAAGKAFVWLSTLRVTDAGVLRLRVTCLNTDFCGGRLALRRADDTVASTASWEVNDDPSFAEFELEQSDRDALAAGAVFTFEAPSGEGRGFTTFLQN